MSRHNKGVFLCYYNFLQIVLFVCIQKNKVVLVEEKLVFN